MEKDSHNCNGLFAKALFVSEMLQACKKKKTLPFTIVWIQTEKCTEEIRSIKKEKRP